MYLLSLVTVYTFNQLQEINMLFLILSPNNMKVNLYDFLYFIEIISERKKHDALQGKQTLMVKNEIL